MDPRRPEHPDPFAAAFLDRLKDRPEAEQFVLGGYFALKHYLDYRDIEARMPIERLPVERREAAADLRAWYRDEFTASPAVDRGDGPHDGEEPSP